MGTYEQLKAAVAAVIKDNGAEEITGDVLQQVLLTIINSVGAGATFAGVATPTTAPSTPDAKMFYLAGKAGTYTNFNLTITKGLWVFENTTGSWVGHDLEVSMLFASGQDVTSTNIAATYAGAGNSDLVTVGAMDEALAGIVGSVALSALDSTRTAGLYRVLGVQSRVVGYLQVNMSLSGTYVIQFLASDISDFDDGYTADYKGHILTRSYNVSAGTWSAWDEYGGGKFASGEKVADVSIAQTLGNSKTSVASQKAVTDAIYNLIDIANIDAMKNDATLRTGGTLARYTATTTLQGVTYKVGILDVMSDSAGHVLTQILTTHYTITSGVLDTSSHSDGAVRQYYRSVKINGGTLPTTDWTLWKPINDELLDVLSASVDAVKASVGYYVCDTAAGTAAKVISATGYELTTGGCIRIKMTYANTVNNATLNINSTGAKALYYDGAQASSTNSWEAGDVLEVYYDGTQYQCASGGGGKFATGEKVKETSITNTLHSGNTDLVTVGAINAVLYGDVEVLTSSDFEQGTFNPSTGGTVVDPQRIRTSEYISVDNGDSIDIVLHGQKYVIYYYDSNKSYINNTGWVTENGTVNITSGGYVKLLIAWTNNGNISPSNYASEISIFRNAGLVREVQRNTSDISALNGRVSNLEDSLSYTYQFTSADFEQGTGVPATGGRADSTTRIRTKTNFPVKAGDVLQIIPNGQQYVIYNYDSTGAYIDSTAWINVENTIDIAEDGYKMILVSFTNSSTIVPEDLAVVIRHKKSRFDEIDEEIAQCNTEISQINEELTDYQSLKYNPLYLGRLQQIGLTNNGFTASVKRVATINCMVVPHVGATIKVKLPDIYHFGVRSGGKASDLNYNDYWISNGDEYTFRTDARFFRISFCKSLTPDSSGSQQDVTAEEIQAAIDSGEIVLSLEQENTVFDRNADCEKYVKAIMRPFVSGATNNYSLTKLPTFAHISDLHGDAKRFKQFMEYAAFLNVDAAFVTGDMVAWKYVSHKEFVDDIAEMFDIPDMQCLGNHECADNRPMDQQAEMIASCIERNGCTVDALATYPTYYYKDFADKQIRIIALNTYEGQHTQDRWYWPKAQCDWFIQTLASTPANYGVIVLSHAPETIPPIDSTYNLFRQPILNYTSAGLSEKPFAHIIDAFIGKTSATISYTSSDGTAVTSQADFTSVNAGVEFIAYANGHLHTDTIGYLPDTTYKQLVLNVCCGISVYGTLDHYLANNSDLPRDAEGATQDSFNVYVVDRDNGVVRVAKVGSHISGAMTDRNWMIIPYRTVNI